MLTLALTQPQPDKERKKAPKLFEGSRLIGDHPMAQDSCGIHSLGFQNPNGPLFKEKEAAGHGVVKFSLFSNF